MPVTFPAEYDTAPCYLVAINRELIPFVAGLLKMMEMRGFWVSDSDYEQGYNAVVAFERCLLATCLNDFMRKQDALYRMLDLALFGKEYTLVDETTGEATPGIPDVHESIYQTGFGLMHQIDDLKQLVDNTVNGTSTDDYSYSPSVKELLQGIIDALAADDADIGSLLTELEVIAGLLA